MKPGRRAYLLTLLSNHDDTRALNLALQTHRHVCCIFPAECVFRATVLHVSNSFLAALLGYDILINLSREKRLVWDTDFRPSSVVYYMVRYPVIAYQVFNVSYTPGVTPQVLLLLQDESFQY